MGSTSPGARPEQILAAPRIRPGESGDSDFLPDSRPLAGAVSPPARPQDDKRAGRGETRLVPPSRAVATATRRSRVTCSSRSLPLCHSVREKKLGEPTAPTSTLRPPKGRTPAWLCTVRPKRTGLARRVSVNWRAHGRSPRTHSSSQSGHSRAVRLLAGASTTDGKGRQAGCPSCVGARQAKSGAGRASANFSLTPRRRAAGRGSSG